MLWHFLSIGIAVLCVADAVKRRPHWIWYAIIVLAYPIGAWIYLVLVALPSWNGQPGLGGGRLRNEPGRGGLESLRANLLRLRSIDHLLELAEALLERREVHEAAALAEEAFALDPAHRRAAFVLGASRLALADFAGAERALAPLVESEPAYRDHEARLLLCEAQWHLHRRDEALRALRDLAQRSRALPHRAVLARFLERAGERKQARLELEEALAEFAEAPEHVRRRLKSEAKQAEQRLAELRREPT